MKPRFKKGTLVTVHTNVDGTYWGKFIKADAWGHVVLEDASWKKEDHRGTSEGHYRRIHIMGAQSVGAQ
jgi:small nuclear ribonucleoprotein (snRNP)-like protein